mmetsp:Transcript_19555/g.48705  ORF Transcript_19555/g.48705 Transcript_19555/m.48705 type:complete len:83 (+) Transcript_19555:94-342(+)
MSSICLKEFDLRRARMKQIGQMLDFWLLACRGGDSCWKTVWHVDPGAPNNALKRFATIVATVGQHEIQNHLSRHSLSRRCTW